MKNKLVIDQETMLHYPNYKSPFLILLHASSKQLGAHAVQLSEIDDDNLSNTEEMLKYYHKPSLLHTKKLNNYQLGGSIVDKELFSIASTLIECKTIL